MPGGFSRTRSSLLGRRKDADHPLEDVPFPLHDFQFLAQASVFFFQTCWSTVARKRILSALCQPALPMAQPATGQAQVPLYLGLIITAGRRQS